MDLYLMRTGRTRWEQEGRIESLSGSPLTEEGARTVRRAAEELRDRGIVAVYAGEGQPERDTAALAAEELDVRVRTRNDLHEQDFGLWQGLTVEEIKRRHPKQYRQWHDAPQTFRAPGGETVEEMAGRLRSALKEITRRQRDGAVLLVLRPMALAMARCVLQGEGPERLWDYVPDELTWTRYEMDPKTL